MPKFIIADDEIIDWIKLKSKERGYVRLFDLIAHLEKCGYSNSGARTLIRNWANNKVIDKFKKPSMSNILVKLLTK